MSYITTALVKHTCENSHFETTRDYISLSKIYSPIDELIADYKQGFTANEQTKLKCYKGYQMEADLMRRLKLIFPNDISGEMEISIEGGLIKGHPDFLFNGDPGDCKSVLRDDWLPVNYFKIPHRIMWQIQAYMLYSKSERGYLIFESRESGLIKDFMILPDKGIMNMIEGKVHEIIKILKP